MERIFPINEERLQSLRGQLVCAVSKKGHHYIGVLHSCRGGRVVLNGPEGGQTVRRPSKPEGIAVKGRGKKGRSRRKKYISAPSGSQGAAELSASYQFRPAFTQPVGLEVGEITFLFALV
ncbi:hypothetical protein ACFOQM_07610 [Paenibacillus sp. GCM10012307]|uniref:Uncharacterized protein n=1 Tax=Paenibacillus roseus TaxID=2798579 RepID=A0A934J1P4_9BACL|nr:hypothetical protein [Paenibacillus roseus]MBJ6361155.1 hypothetical protein [Paenibacillus roseus]